MKGLGDIMKQAKEMQENMEKLQEELANLEVQGQSGAGMVKVTMTGRHDVRRVELDPDLLTDTDASPQENKEMLEDLIAAAVNDAVRKVEEANKEKVGGLTAGLNVPGGFKFPF